MATTTEECEQVATCEDVQTQGSRVTEAREVPRSEGERVEDRSVPVDTSNDGCASQEAPMTTVVDVAASIANRKHSRSPTRAVGFTRVAPTNNHDSPDTLPLAYVGVREWGGSWGSGTIYDDEDLLPNETARQTRSSLVGEGVPLEGSTHRSTSARLKEPPLHESLAGCHSPPLPCADEGRNQREPHEDAAESVSGAGVQFCPFQLGYEHKFYKCESKTMIELAKVQDSQAVCNPPQAVVNPGDSVVETAGPTLPRTSEVWKKYLEWNVVARPYRWATLIWRGLRNFLARLSPTR
ncbi:uncharacterized protein F5Z01DRAFT_5029 [Emericellopsis atlantica]|uniref:Uncharacterized protein n=1 Tax=Emericellopsis atlantica TaxID=2614577 RepID=A0A9P7ZWB3_9HYPO|nr:uncharacterized protein F5Z01DRAFT_5029 [Emericellopsis atlantica]KAG9258827.1 hypothetical protein F5Z01DRAFT_5029 [Emericellopsis atlantica]